jgi:hypothetical protein
MNTPASSENDPAHWRQRAEDARRAADEAVDPIEKSTLLDITTAYEQLAALTEAKLITEK